MPKAAPAEMVDLYTVNGGRKSARIPRRRYDAIRHGIHQALHNCPDGLTLKELAVAQAHHLPQWWFDDGWDTMWHTTGVKLHLEYLGELERLTGSRPHRVRLARASQG